METIKKLIYLLNNQERKRVVLLLGMIIVMALLDMLGVASIIPFMTVMTNPDIIETNTIINNMFLIANQYGIETNRQFLFALGIIVFILLVISLSFRAFTTYFQLHFILKLEYSLAKRLFQGYLHQPYSWFLNRHSADLGKTILSEVSVICGSGLHPLLVIISQIIVTFALITLLIIVDPKITLIACFVLGSSYGIFYRFIRGFLSKFGEERFNANTQRFTAITEAFGAVKEVKMGGLEQNYTQRFAKPAKIFIKKQASVEILKQLPRYALELFAFGGLLLLALYLLSQGGISETIPLIALYAFAGYRLMPALQSIYSSVTTLRFVGPAIDAMHNDLKSLQPTEFKNINDSVPLKKAITLKNIHYHYPNVSRTALKGVSLSIPAYSKIGIVGITGSGKTTIVDIILGLLDAQQGILEVDDKVINKQNCRTWQKSIGYVPQQIYLSDDTISANIAFGIDLKNISQDAVQRAAKIANLHEFIINELPLKYQTTVGERGIRLSGGQRQRIGIARALYHNPQVLILDEATNALDNLTEQSVMEEVYSISKNITVIMIAHRLTTVKKCDSIILLEKGEVKGQGTFDELIKTNDSFRATAIKI